MKKINFLKTILLGTIIAFVPFGCTDLEETLNSELSGELAIATFDAQQLLDGAYNNLQSFTDQALVWSLQEHSSDELIGPTRGGDWDDNGRWRVFHSHTWDADSQNIRDSFNNLLNGLFNSNQVLSFNPSSQQEAEALFLRAFFTYWVNDLFGQVPFREPNENLLDAPRVLTRAEAVAQVIADLNAALPNLSDAGAPEIATKNAARMLLARTHLNKFVYEGEASPSAGDMDQVINFSQQIIDSGLFSLNDGADWYLNFAPGNESNGGTENIFVVDYTAGVNAVIGNNTRCRYFCSMHYDQNPSGWNGFTTIADFYDTFTDDDDVRKTYDGSDFTANTGTNLGLVAGPQFTSGGQPLMDSRSGVQLDFIKEVKLIESGATLTNSGVRVVKFTPDFNNGDNVDIDNPLMRYGEVFLNIAEANLWKGETGNALAYVNMLREKRGANELTSIDATAMLNERGYELYWEGLRRTDQIRFGDFNNAWDEKPASEATRNLFPIPATALGANPNLTQNPGY